MDWIPFRSRVCRRLFKKLDKNKATGNDMISAEILKMLGDVLYLPFTKVCQRLFHEGCWPDVWKKHLIVPIYKRDPAFEPGNYRGVHLTTILSKIAEKMIALQLVPYLRRHAFRENQWAFSTGLSARDLVTMLVLSWILAICTGNKVAAYLSDISGAFDKVFVPYLLAKLHRYGVGTTLLNFLASYLSPRSGQVLVQGAYSDPYEISNTVFQGTVLGPPLWNTFFSDVALPARTNGGHEAMFADDLNVFQRFSKSTPLDECKEAMAKCKESIHKWGGNEQNNLRCRQGTCDNYSSHIISRGHLQIIGLSYGRGPSHAFCRGTSIEQDSSQGYSDFKNASILFTGESHTSVQDTDVGTD